MPPLPDNRRILIVDDNPAIHQDFAKILAAPAASADELAQLEAQMFDTDGPTPSSAVFELTFASQGAEALQHVTDATEPFALAFIDMRMPPGWDGVETIERIWQVDPAIQIVICSAYSDHSWSDLARRLGDRDSLLIIKKPFDTIEVIQCAHALTAKWNLVRKVRSQVEDLEHRVASRTAELVLANDRLAAELIERDRVEEELRLSQRMLAIGQLAAGIAHEISTPIQYVGDNLEFLREGLTQITSETDLVSRLDGTPYTADEADDLAYTIERLPAAFAAIEHGVARVSGIVRSMREFAHPGSGEPAPADVNRALLNTLVVTANTYNASADLETSFDDTLPLLGCHIADLNQVFLNLIVNAAHAMEGRPKRGTLGVTTKRDGDDIVISISDTGTGIPEEIRGQIFNPFFTTKTIGRGTGQGLGVSRRIVERHHGIITFETAVDLGTTFHIRLPIRPTQSAGARSYLPPLAAAS